MINQESFVEQDQVKRMTQNNY